MPIVLAACSAVLIFYNMTVWDAMVWFFGRMLDGCTILSAWLLGQFGEPAVKFVFTISILYIMMMSIALCWLVLFRIFGRLVWACLQHLGFVSSSVSKVGSDDAKRPAQSVDVPSDGVSSSAQSETITNDVPCPSLSDVSSIDSVVSSLDGSVVTSRRVCQAHLLYLDTATSTAVALKPCMSKPVKTIPLLNRDCLVQNGVRAVGVDGPVFINLCKLHREFYVGRTVERKCQTKG